MASRFGHNLVARLALAPLATLRVAAGPPEREEKPACDQLPACRSLKAVGLESQAKGQLGVALERLRAAYALSQDYRLQAPLGRVLQQLAGATTRSLRSSYSSKPPPMTTRCALPYRSGCAR